jgi:hypothetical protein
MPRLTDAEKQEVLRFLESDKPLPEKYRFLLFDEKREVELVWNGKTGEVCNVVLPFQTIEQVDEPRAEGGKASDGRQQASGGRESFRTKKERKLELTSAVHECQPGRRKIAVKVVDIFGNDTMTIIEVSVGKNGKNGGKR